MPVEYGSDVARVVTVRRDRQTHEDQNAFVRQDETFCLDKPKHKLNNKAEPKEQEQRMDGTRRDFDASFVYLVQEHYACA